MRVRRKIRPAFLASARVDREIAKAQRLLNRLWAVRKSVAATEYPAVVGHAGNAVYTMFDAGLTIIDRAGFEAAFDRDVSQYLRQRFAVKLKSVKS